MTRQPRRIEHGTNTGPRDAIRAWIAASGRYPSSPTGSVTDEAQPSRGSLLLETRFRLTERQTTPRVEDLPDPLESDQRKILAQITPPEGTVAVFRVRRDLEYGLSFYRDQKVVNYELNGVPPQQHILVVRESYIDQLRPLLTGRTYEPLFTYPAQNLVVYSVAARQ